ncbi:MAG: carboxypeptidase-like regulatory domain-containing protein, partial [Gemmatimonadaceae bacterium]
MEGCPSRACHAGDTMQIVTVNGSSAVMRRWIASARAAAPIAAAALLAATCPPAPLAAQASTPTGAIVATVRDTTHAAIAGAELLLTGSVVHGFTDDEGMVRLAPIGAGPVHLTVRRLGFRPATLDVTVAAGAPTNASVQLVQVAQQLAPVLVRGTARAYGDQMEGFYNRRAHRSGHFITRGDIEQAQPSRLTDMFRTIPGIRLGSTGMIQNA